MVSSVVSVIVVSNIQEGNMLHFVDTETTGLDCFKHEIIEIAIITELGDGSIERWCTKVKPERLLEASPEALKINGYTDAAWADAPCMAQVIEVIRDKLCKGTLVGHNIPFDVGFIREAYRRCGLDSSLKENRIGRHNVDTITLAHEHLHPMGLSSLSLDSIRTFVGWGHDNSHTALQDAEDCRKLYWSLLRKHWSQL